MSEERKLGIWEKYLTLWGAVCLFAMICPIMVRIDSRQEIYEKKKSKKSEEYL